MKITIYKNGELGDYISRDYDLTNCSVDELERSLAGHCELTTADPVTAAIEVELPIPAWKHDKLIVKGTSTEMSLHDAAFEILDLYGREFCHGAKGKFTKHQFIALCTGIDTLHLKEKKTELKNLFEAWFNGPKPEKKHDPGTPMSHEDFSLSVYLLSEQIYFLEKNVTDSPDGYEIDWKAYLENGVWKKD
jgi:hypothetical protein